VHHAVGIRIGIASAEADQVHWLSAKMTHDLTRDMVRAFHKVRHRYAIADTLSAIGSEKAAKLTAI